MIFEGLAAGVRILLEKGPSRHHVSADQEIPEKYQKNNRKLYFAKRLKKPKGGNERSNKVGSPTGGAGPPLAAPTYGEATLAAPACGEATLAHYCHRPLAYIIVPKNLSQRGGHQR
jgi:hypothetical protein